MRLFAFLTGVISVLEMQVERFSHLWMELLTVLTLHYARLTDYWWLYKSGVLIFSSNSKKRKGAFPELFL